MSEESEFTDAVGHPVEPDEDEFGVKWYGLGEGDAAGTRRVAPYEDGNPNSPENVRLHYLDWEIAFEHGHPVLPNGQRQRTYGRAATKPWLKTLVPEIP